MTEIDISNVEAGEYVLVAYSWDQITSKPGQPYDYDTRHQGDVVTLDRAEARRLVKARAVVTKEAYEKQASGAPAASPIAVLDEEGLATLREKLDLDDDADQDAILAALDARGTLVAETPWWGDGEEPKTIQQIEAKVGSDKALTAAALAAEYAAAKPRPMLIAQLTGALAAGDGA